MLSPQDEEFLEGIRTWPELKEDIYGRQIFKLLRIVGELKAQLEPCLNGEPFDGLVRSMAQKNAELKKERDGLKEAIKEAKFIRCETPHDILVIPDSANPEDFCHVQNPCHNHSIMRRCEYLKPKP